MLLFGYSITCGLISFVLQLVIITIKFCHDSKDLDPEKENKRIIKLLIKLLISLFISICIGIISFFVIGLATMIGLQEGR